MSKITERHNIIKEVQIGTKCDFCGKETDKNPFDWYSFDHHHGDWGNDSVESYEYFDVCSTECFKGQLQKSLNDIGNYRSGIVAGMPVEFAKKLLKSLK
jgi:hypothetical protein